MRRTGAWPCVISLLLGSSHSTATVQIRPEAGHTIAFASFAPLNTDIFIADCDGSNAKPLIAHPDLDYNSSFSPDARWIVFTSTRAGSADLFRVRPTGHGLQRLTDDAAFDDQGVVSPVGRRVAFVSTRTGQADIWILELDFFTRSFDVGRHPDYDVLVARVMDAITDPKQLDTYSPPAT